MGPLLKITPANRKWWILFAMTSSVAMVFLDQTIVGVTLPTVHKDLNTSTLATQWMVNAYLLTLSALALGMGRLSDISGHRTVFFWGTAIFALSSALCGMSPNAAWFISSRVLQGVGGALIYPSTTAIIYESFPEKERGRAMGLFVSVGGIFLSLGPFIGGFLTQYMNWRMVFWINLPIAAIGIFLTLLSVPPSKKQPVSFDFWGFVPLCLGNILLVLFVMQGRKWGWESPLTISAFFGSILFLLLFYLRDRKAKAPLVDFSLFRKRVFSGGMLTTFFTAFILMITIFWSIYFQTYFKYSPVDAGLFMVIASVPVIFMAPLAGHTLDRIGPKAPVIIGFCLLALALFCLGTFSEANHVLLLVPALFFFGCGVPLIFTPSSVATLSQAPVKRRGQAVGMYMALRQFGATLGLAVFGTTFIEMHYYEMSKLVGSREIEGMPLKHFDGLMSGAPDALNMLKNLSEKGQELVLTSFSKSYQLAFRDINFLAGSVAILGIIAAISFLIHRSRGIQKKEPPPSQDESTPS